MSAISSISVELGKVPASAEEARRLVREHGRLDGLREAEAALLVTEAVGNILNHANEASGFTLRVERNPSRGLLVEVSHPHSQPLDDVDHGVGFFLIDRLAKSWGHSLEEGRLKVWFVVPTPGSRQIPADTPDETLFEYFAEDPDAYSQELMRRHGDLAASIAKRYSGKGIDQEDLLQVANMALLKAFLRFDGSLGGIRPYAAATISGELKKTLRDRGWSVRVPRSLQEDALLVGRGEQELRHALDRDPTPAELADHLDMDEEEVLEALRVRQAYAAKSVDKPRPETGTTLGDELEAIDLPMRTVDDRLMVEEAIEALPERERRILAMRFYQDMTQSEIAEKVGLSQMHVSRLLAASIEAIRDQLGAAR
ncbi:MAG: sigma-70 family RNA polymerase sigma factor [Acidimicrobiia bacterium]|nr:sigma-70 family RNA polymerase sigma factor [Acidimicrobiia bacterium]